ncbi:hypothetical protein GE21DRAFT_3740 [Neurospora crassa]|uniref:Uncharacterized protein n=2 Tax=Neurospora crassa TaxID=5141 RepID=Q7SC11_NEUCR|nr:hypothetical protein NCU09470 [Neurospora crassa OR74A]EAA33989.2 hypothetical protein NCU09470 [Neurospora crassa OR74A]KHE83357.1 hypothetical protein GE21DRAFT_3740 [Neurospora crassa]CAE75718.1 putative protein [Neurospora crassa]|eukprot:XP_963225.2 hypothetical protein NCU09470 [Neurospora crassa OR74A]
MGGTEKLRKVFGLKPKSSSANLQPQPITPDNFNDNDLNANGIYSTNGGYQSYTPNGSSAFASNNYGQPPGLSSISELPANDYGNGYPHHSPSHQGHGHQHRKSLPAQARPGPNPQYPHDPNAYYQHHDRSSGNLSPQDAVHPQNGSSNRDRRSASLGSRLSLSNFGSTSSNSSLGRSSVTTMSTMSSAATSPGPASPHHLSQSQHPHCLSPGYQQQPNSPRYPGQPVHQDPQAQQQQQQQQQHDQAKHRNPLSSSRHRTTSQQYPPQHNVLHKLMPSVQPPYPVSERGSPPPPHSRSSHSTSTSTSNPLHNLHSFANRTSSHSAQPQQQSQSPTATDIRRTTKLLRRMFELRLEQWALTHSHESDQHLLYEKQSQVDAVLADILGNVRGWGIERGRNKTWTDDEWEDICLVRDVLAEMSAPSGGRPGGGQMGMGMGMGYGIGGGGRGGVGGVPVEVEVGGGGGGERRRRW